MRDNTDTTMTLDTAQMDGVWNNQPLVLVGHMTHRHHMVHDKYNVKKIHGDVSGTKRWFIK